jgi:hypothetical protein
MLIQVSLRSAQAFLPADRPPLPPPATAADLQGSRVLFLEVAVGENKFERSIDQWIVGEVGEGSKLKAVEDIGKPYQHLSLSALYFIF